MAKKLSRIDYRPYYPDAPLAFESISFQHKYHLQWQLQRLKDKLLKT